MPFVLAEICVFGNVDKFLPDYTALRPRKLMLHSHRLDNLIPNVTRCDLVLIFNQEVEGTTISLHVGKYPTSLRHIPEDLKLWQHRYENLKYCILTFRSNLLPPSSG
jgi:hypothetical protein